jgi:hypothetical protein
MKIPIGLAFSSCAGGVPLRYPAAPCKSMNIDPAIQHAQAFLYELLSPLWSNAFLSKGR